MAPYFFDVLPEYRTENVCARASQSCVAETWERLTGKGNVMFAAHDTQNVRSGWSVMKAFLAFLFAVIAGFGLLTMTAEPAHAKTGLWG